MLSPDVGCLQTALVAVPRIVPTPASLEAENLALRQQIIVLQRAPKRLCFNTFDRLIFVGLYRLFPDFRHALAVSFAGTVLGSELIGVGGQGRDGEDRRCRLRSAN